MAFRALLCVAVAVIAFWFHGITKQVVNYIDEDVTSTPATVAACNVKIETSNDVLAYTKSCLGFSNKAMDCVADFIQKREKDPFPIATECTPNMPESVRETLRKMLGIMNNRTELESRCRMHDTMECTNQLFVINEKYDKVITKFRDLSGKLNGLAKEAV